MCYKITIIRGYNIIVRDASLFAETPRDCVSKAFAKLNIPIKIIDRCNKTVYDIEKQSGVDFVVAVQCKTTTYFVVS